jgi:GLPGLI family protein
VKGQKITAWFTGDIPISGGPEQVYGLPGMILELDADDGTVMAIATSVEFKEVDKELTLPKLKGKKVNNQEFDAVISKYINDSIKMQRNPYWAIRY